MTQALHVPWTKLMRDLEEARNLRDLQTAHSRYVNAACLRCFQSGQTEKVRKCEMFLAQTNMAPTLKVRGHIAYIFVHVLRFKTRLSEAASSDQEDFITVFKELNNVIQSIR